MMRKMGTMDREELGLEDWFSPLGPYQLKDKVGMGLACVTLRMSLRKWRYVGHLQWDIMRKGPTDWATLYGYGVLGMGYTIYSRDVIFKQKVCAPQGDHGLENLCGDQNYG